MHLCELTEELLTSTFHHVLAEKRSLPWQVKGVPSVGFYRAIHPYLKRQPQVTKVAIGKFYIAIDSNFKEKGSRPDNVYRFIERITKSQQQSDKPMVYVKDLYRKEVKDLTSQLKQCNEQLIELNTECSELKQQFKDSRDQLGASKIALGDITNEKRELVTYLSAK